MSQADQFVAAARAEIGKPYVFGDEGPASFDCSGLIQFCLAKIGIKAPRIAEDQQKWATPVSNPRAGDLVFWGRPATHVGLYIGDGKMIAAPHKGALVQVQNVYGTPSGYGRVPGLGAALSPIVDLVSGVGSGLQDVAFSTADVLGVARRVLLEVAVAGLGLALIGYGLWRTLKPRISNTVDQVGDLL